MVSRAAAHLCEPSGPSFLKRIEEKKKQRELKVNEYCGLGHRVGIGWWSLRVSVHSDVNSGLDVGA